MTGGMPSAAQVRRRGVPLVLLGVALVIALPLFVLLAELLTPQVDFWAQIASTTLPRMIGNTLLLMGGVALLAGVLGVGLAWLVTMYAFPLRRVFERALLLPLAIPSFVMGFVFMATFDFAGPVQTFWRDTFGRGAWFPEIRSSGGAIIVLSLVLYPYVYLLARAAFREQGARTIEAARVMGLSRTGAFFRVALPMARPNLAAGISLAMMEAMTDFGTVRFFNFHTLSEGIVRTWEGRMDRAAASELAALLLLFAVLVISLERWLRGGARYSHQGGAEFVLHRHRLRGWKQLFAVGVCAAVLGVAFVLPVGQLVGWLFAELNETALGSWTTVYWQYVGNTAGLAGIAAVVAVTVAVLMVFASRRFTSPWARRLVRLSTLGYAMPGAVVAAGVLLTLAPVDHALNDLLGGGIGLVLTGSLVGLIYAYTVRFMSVSYSSIESSAEKIRPSLEQAARLMGASSWRILLRVRVPLIVNGLAAGLMLVFVDVMKELPATLLLRPFGMDTLAIWTYMLAAESFWQAAAVPALTIVAVGLIPVALLMRLGK
jgi:iron(III) transport system permease protein